MKGQVLSAALIAFSIVVLGFAIKGGIDNFVNKDNKVTVKGLSEKEVEADKVTWPIFIPAMSRVIAITSPHR